jgi:transmembrane sensor
MDSIHKQYFLEILKKYNAGQANEKEIQFLESFYALYESNDDWGMEESAENHIRNMIKAKIDAQIVMSSERKAPLAKDNKFGLRVKIFAAAASILLALSVAVIFRMSRLESSQRLFAAGKQLKPGGNTATLILADGSRVLLNEASNGLISNQGGMMVSKSNEGKLVYTVKENRGALNNLQDSAKYNTIETPKGGQYQVSLPDGTNVWLNAGSSLRYPTVFSGQQRAVQLDGEAYFEVAKDAGMPFRVKTDQQLVEVLGTHFNISSYHDDPIVKTTLTEGKVRLASLRSRQIVLLNPGEQALAYQDGTLKVNAVNADQFLGWKEGKFIFTDADLQSIMRQVSRWYNVEIIYKGAISKEKFEGSASRFTNVAELLEILELTHQVHFEIQGRRIIVMP